MLVIGQKRESPRVVLRAAVPAVPEVRKARKIVTPGRDAEPEAYVIFAPITPAMRRRAGRATRRLIGDIEQISDLDADQLIDASEAGAKELIRLGALEWGGIGDADGNPLPLTPDRDTRLETSSKPDRPTGTIDLLLDEEDIFERLADQYVRPDAERRAEKNALSALPSGTGEAAMQGKTTAGSVANRKTRRTAAKNARTSSTRSTAKRPKRSGKP